MAIEKDNKVGILERDGSNLISFDFEMMSSALKGDLSEYEL